MIAAFHPGFLILPAVVGGVVVLLWALRAQARKVRDQMHGFAGARNLRLQEETVLGFVSVKSLEGQQSGRMIRYWTYSTGSGKSRTNWIAVGVQPRAATGLQFDLTRQNFGSKILGMFGVKEIQVGDPAFDAAWFVRTNQPDFLGAALVPSIRTRLMADPKGRWGSRYKLDGGLVHYVEQGWFNGTAALERLEQQLPLLHELADVAEVSAAAPR